MKKIKGGVTPCLSECYHYCSVVGGGAAAVAACREDCRLYVCVED